MLAASGAGPGERLDRFAFCGELSLKGELIATPGVLAVAMAAAEAGLEGVAVPEANREEAELVEGLRVVAAPSSRRWPGSCAERGSRTAGRPPSS